MMKWWKTKKLTDKSSVSQKKKKNKTKSSPCIDYYYNDKQVLTGKHF